jgi:hypothetical protein
VTPLPGCDLAALGSDNAFVVTAPKVCGSRYTDAQSKVWDVCSSAAVGACTSHLVVGTVLQSLACHCPWPEFLNPAASGPGFASYPLGAAYQPAGGCIAPMRLTDYAVIQKRVVVGLSKPASLEHSLNVTLYVEGTDVARPANWSVVDASFVLNDALFELRRNPWLRLPAIAGETDAHAILAGRTEVLLPLSISAANLRERAAPYEETLAIEVRSSYAAVAKTQLLDVALTVQASTSFVVWGLVSDAGYCMPTAQNASHASIADEVQHQSFTACGVPRTRLKLGGTKSKRSDWTACVVNGGRC